MQPILFFWIAFLVLLALMIFLDRKFQMLRDNSVALPKPYSYARVQLAWWTLVVLSCLIAILLARNAMPTLDSSTLILLGMSAGTTVVARLTDISDRNNSGTDLVSQDFNGENFLLDILSDKNGVSIHRLQSVLINIIFGVWFIVQVLRHLTGVNPCLPGDLDCGKHPLDFIIPVISTNNLILLGLSSGTYVALKTMENKTGG